MKRIIQNPPEDPLRANMESYPATPSHSFRLSIIVYFMVENVKIRLIRYRTSCPFGGYNGCSLNSIFPKVGWS